MRLAMHRGRWRFGSLMLFMYTTNQHNIADILSVDYSLLGVHLAMSSAYEGSYHRQDPAFRTRCLVQGHSYPPYCYLSILFHTQEREWPLSSQEPPTPLVSGEPMFVFFVVKVGGNNHLAQINSTTITTNRVFSKFRQEYCRLREPWRHWYSVWVYSHSDFCIVGSFRAYDILY